MKLFNKKEEKNKVGRPKLADYDTKKKAIISVCVALVLVITIALTGAFKLNIINFNKLKGTINCTEIPAELQPGGNHEYGFTDLNFYSTVVSNAYNNSTDATYCSSITENKLSEIKSLYISGGIENTDGIQYLKGLETLNLTGVSLEDIDLSENKTLNSIFLSVSNLKNINLLNNKNLTYLHLSNSDIESIDLSNNHLINDLGLRGNSKLKSVDLSGNIALKKIDRNVFDDGLEYININGMTALTTLGLVNHNLNGLDLDLSSNTALKDFQSYNSGIKSVNLSNNLNLEILRLAEENISNLDLKNNVKLNTMDLINMTLDELDLTNNISLVRLSLYDFAEYDNNINIGTLNLNGLANLKSLEINSNNTIIGNLNLKDTPSLKTLKLTNAIIGKLDLSNSGVSGMSTPKQLNELIMNGNPTQNLSLNNVSLKKVDLSNMEQLNSLDLSDNSISELNMDNVNLTYIMLDNNNINTIDLSGSDKLIELSIQNNNLSNINLENNTLLNNLHLSNNNLVGKLDLNKLSYLEVFEASNNKLNEVIFPSSNVLYRVLLTNNDLNGKLDLSKNTNLEYVYLENNKLNEVIIGNNESLLELGLNGNNLSKVDLSDVSNLNFLSIYKNPLLDTIYITKEKTIKYNENISLNENRKPKYNVVDNNVVSYKDGVLKALKEGVTNVEMSNENIDGYTMEYIEKCMIDYDNNVGYCENLSDEDMMLPYFLSQKIKVYDILSDVYKIDKDKKTIDASGLDLDISKIKLTLEGLSAVVSGDNFIIKDGDTVVDTYKILNMKKVIDKPSSDNNDKTTTTKKPSANKGTNNKKNTTTNKKATTTEDLSDIEINGSFVSVLALGQVNGKDRNIVVKNDDITVTINGKDIEKIEGNLDLSYELKVLKESLIYNEVKDKVPSGMVLSFKGNNSLPGKVLISLDVTDIIKKNAGTRNLRLYSYKNGELTLVAKNINPKDKKLSFYVNELGSYVLTDKELEGKEIKEDTKLLESNNKINKGISFRCILWLILILIILGIIGYIIYKKRKNKSY